MSNLDQILSLDAGDDLFGSKKPEPPQAAGAGIAQNGEDLFNFKDIIAKMEANISANGGSGTAFQKAQPPPS